MKKIIPHLDFREDYTGIKIYDHPFSKNMLERNGLYHIGEGYTTIAIHFSGNYLRGSGLTMSLTPHYIIGIDLFTTPETLDYPFVVKSNGEWGKFHEKFSNYRMKLAASSSNHSKLDGFLFKRKINSTINALLQEEDSRRKFGKVVLDKFIESGFLISKEIEQKKEKTADIIPLFV
jgi:hypothetical protein